MKPTVDEVLEANGVECSFNVLELSRHLGHMPRCHTLAFNRRPTVAEHTLNCLFLLDYAHNNGCIEPSLSQDQYQQLKNYLQYHDLQEAIAGDVPYPVSRYTAEFEAQVHTELMKTFKVSVELTPELMNLARQFDMIEFLYSTLEDLDGMEVNLASFAKQRVQRAAVNAEEAYHKLLETATYSLKLESLKEVKW